MCMFCRSLFVLLSFFFLAIVLSVLLRFMDSNYPIGIFKLILQRCTVYMKSYARACASTVNVLQRVELLSLTLIKQGYVDSKVKYLKYCILFQLFFLFVYTGSFTRDDDFVSLLSQFASTNNIGFVNQYAFSNNKEISLKIASSFHALLTYLKRRDRYTWIILFA